MFKDLLQGLPLDSISEWLAKIVLWWVQVVDGIPEQELAFNVYVGGSIIALILLMFALRLVPRMFRGIIWVISAAILLTPGTTLGGTGEIAPAIIGVLYSFLMKDTAQAMSGILSILGVAIGGLILGAMWQLLRAVIEYYFGDNTNQYGEEFDNTGYYR